MHPKIEIKWTYFVIWTNTCTNFMTKYQKLILKLLTQPAPSPPKHGNHKIEIIISEKLNMFMCVRFVMG